MDPGKFNIVSLTDWHVPYHDPLAINAALGFVAKLQPQVLVVHEVHDFYALSRFDKDPARINSLQDEIDQVTAYFTVLRNTCPAARIILLKSNHLARLKKYLWKNAPALASLRALHIEGLLELEKHRIEYMDDFTHQGFLFKHGSIVRAGSGMTARAELIKEGVSGASGHTHRLAQIYRRIRGGAFTWIESGCLCKLDPDYLEGTADWQQGFSWVSFASPQRKTYWATAVPIIDYEVPL